MVLSKHQKSIINYLSTVESANLDEIYANTDIYYHQNEKHHIGIVLSNMVKQGLILRVKKGCFRCFTLNEQIENLSKSNKLPLLPLFSNEAVE